MYFPTFGGFTFTDQEGADGVSWGQQLPLSVFPADSLEKPPEKDQNIHHAVPTTTTSFIVLLERVVTTETHSSASSVSLAT